jgi:hypothetical protein
MLRGWVQGRSKRCAALYPFLAALNCLVDFGVSQPVIERVVRAAVEADDARHCEIWWHSGGSWKLTSFGAIGWQTRGADVPDHQKNSIDPEEFRILLAGSPISEIPSGNLG